MLTIINIILINTFVDINLFADLLDLAKMSPAAVP